MNQFINALNGEAPEDEIFMDLFFDYSEEGMPDLSAEKEMEIAELKAFLKQKIEEISSKKYQFENNRTKDKISALQWAMNKTQEIANTYEKKMAGRPELKNQFFNIWQDAVSKRGKSDPVLNDFVKGGQNDRK